MHVVCPTLAGYLTWNKKKKMIVSLLPLTSGRCIALSFWICKADEVQENYWMTFIDENTFVEWFTLEVMSRSFFRFPFLKNLFSSWLPSQSINKMDVHKGQLVVSIFIIGINGLNGISSLYFFACSEMNLNCMYLFIYSAVKINRHHILVMGECSNRRLGGELKVGLRK